MQHTCTLTNLQESIKPTQTPDQPLYTFVKYVVAICARVHIFIVHEHQSQNIIAQTQPLPIVFVTILMNVCMQTCGAHMYMILTI